MSIGGSAGVIYNAVLRRPVDVRHLMPSEERRRSWLVAALAEPFREAFVLREIENLSYREIADVSEVPVGTVMSRLARARAMLRSAWLAEQEQAK